MTASAGGIRGVRAARRIALRAGDYFLGHFVSGNHAATPVLGEATAHGDGSAVAVALDEPRLVVAILRKTVWKRMPGSAARPGFRDLRAPWCLKNPSALRRRDSEIPQGRPRSRFVRKGWLKRSRRFHPGSLEPDLFSPGVPLSSVSVRLPSVTPPAQGPDVPHDAPSTTAGRHHVAQHLGQPPARGTGRSPG